MGSSGIAAGATLKVKPAWASNSLRRGDAEASTSIFLLWLMGNARAPSGDLPIWANFNPRPNQHQLPNCSIPFIGHHAGLDRAMRDGSLGCSELLGMRRVGRNNWVEVPIPKLLGCRLEPPYRFGGRYRRTKAVAFAWFRPS